MTGLHWLQVIDISMHDKLLDDAISACGGVSDHLATELSDCLFKTFTLGTSVVKFGNGLRGYGAPDLSLKNYGDSTSVLARLDGSNDGGTYNLYPLKPDATTPSTTPSTKPPATPSQPSFSASPKFAGPDGVCGAKNGAICPADACCSNSGYCGKTDAYCGDGCQSAYSSCKSNMAGSDGKCGPAAGKHCPSDMCCSGSGFCGSTAKHCAPGCFTAFGKSC